MTRVAFGLLVASLIGKYADSGNLGNGFA